MLGLQALGQQKAQTEKIIDGPRIEQVTNNSAEIAWTTNTGGSSVVKYGTDPSRLDRTAESPYADKEGAAYQTHRVQIKGLQPNTKYYYEVVSGQGEGTGSSAQSKVSEFQTKPGSGPSAGKAGSEKIIDGPRVEQLTNNSAQIAWSTNTGGSSVIKYGTDPNHLDKMAESPYADKEGAAYQTHRVAVKNLQPNTTYYYTVISGQGEDTGTSAQSKVEQFKTK